MKKFNLKMDKKKLIRNCIIGAVVISLFPISYFVMKKFGNNGVVSAQTAVVTRGNISKSIEGTGTIEALNQYEVTSLVKGEILADYFEEGQNVTKGDLLYKIDSSDMQNSIEKSKNSLEKAKISNQQNKTSLSDLTVSSPISGIITNLYVEKDSNIANNAKIADIVNNETMILKVNFNSNDIGNIYYGDYATVYMEDSSAPLNGTVTNVSSGTMVNEFGVSVNAVEISVQNPGGINEGDKATAIIKDYACNSSGTFEYSDKVTVTSKASGDIIALTKKVGDYIKSGEKLLEIDGENLILTEQQNQLNIKDAELALSNLNEQLENYNITAPISGKVIQKTSKAGEKIDNTNSNTVMATIADLSSLIFTMDVDELDISQIKVGQTVEVTADAIPNKTFYGHVDNISILGSATNGVTSYPVKVTIDASEDLIPGMNVNAKIVIEQKDNVLRLPVAAVNRGNIVYRKIDGSSNKSTKNPQESPSLDKKPTESKNPQETNEPSEQTDNKPQEDKNTQPTTKPSENTEQSPKTEESVNKEQSTNENTENAPAARRKNRSNQEQPTGEKTSSNVVYAAEADSTPSNTKAKNANARNTAPEGYEIVNVEIGITDGTFVEIVSGLNEGDVIKLPDVSTDSSSSKSTTNQQSGGMPGMGGGMPGMGGGMPAGGSSRSTTNRSNNR